MLRRQLRYPLMLEAMKHHNLRAQGLKFRGASLKKIDRRSCHYIRPAHGITNKSLVHFFFFVRVLWFLCKSWSDQPAKKRETIWDNKVYNQEKSQHK